ncbi:MAG: hypothetical protein WBI20_05765 [Burkholderiaceae bacterium]
MFEKLITMGWRLVEASLVLVILCVILNIIVGADSGSFISAVAANFQRFLKDIPPGTILGVVLLVGLFLIYKSRTQK